MLRSLKQLFLFKSTPTARWAGMARYELNGSGIESR